MVVIGWIGSVTWGWFRIWSKMRADYNEEKIFELLSWLTLGGVVGGFISYELGFGWIGAYSLMFVLGMVIIMHRHWDLWEWMDSLSVVGMALICMIMAINRDIYRLSALLFGTVLINFIANNYRGFRWYKSGKTGLAFAFGWLWWGVSELVVVNLRGFRIYWFGLSPVVILSIIMVVTGVTVIIGRLQTGEIGNIWQKLHLKKRI